MLTSGNPDLNINQELQRLRIERDELQKKLDRFNENYHIISSMISDYIYFANVTPDNKIEQEWESSALQQVQAITGNDGFGIDDNFLDIVHPDDRRHLLQRKEFILSNREHICEYRIISHEERTLWLREYIKPVWDDKEKRVIRIIGAIQDITSQKEAEQEKINLQKHIQHQKRMEAIGTLAGGIAHEINNPLTGIINYAQLLQDQLDNDILKNFTKGIIDQGQRVAEIIRNLLTFSRTDYQKPSFSSVQEVINSTLSLLATPLRHSKIIATTQFEPGVPPIMMNRQKIQLVILNIMDNAIYALNQKYPERNENKQILISTGQYTENDIQYIQISIRDEGIGIPPDIMNKVFEPFYTTKSQFEHAGLGLSESYNILREYNGKISIESAIEEYTVVHFDLPVSTEHFSDFASDSSSVLS